MFTPPAEVEAVCAAFTSLFTRPSWRRAQALLCGVLLAPANRALTAALRAMGLAADRRFQNYHRLLNRARWSARAAAGTLLRLLVAAFAPAGLLILGWDETVERRRGPKITARAIYRDHGALQPGVFSENQRPALAEPAPARAGALGQARVGVAFSDGPLPFGALRPLRGKRPPSQVARRACPWPHRSGGALAAGPRPGRGGGQRLRGHRTAGVVPATAAVWYHSGLPPVALRRVLIRDPKGRFAPQAPLSTNPALEATPIVRCVAASGGNWLFACRPMTPTARNLLPVSAPTSANCSPTPPDFGARAPAATSVPPCAPCKPPTNP